VTDFGTFCGVLTDYANRQDWSPDLVTSFVRNAEEKLNAELRIDRMIVDTQNTVTCSCAELPDDWLESDLMLMGNATTPTGWVPIRYKPRDEFFRIPATPYSGTYTQNYNSTYGFYTIEGRTIYFGGVPDEVEGRLFKLSYYAEVPVFSDTVSSWVYTKYQALYRCAALMHADLHAVGEEDKAGEMKQLAEDMITKLNNDHMRARASGSRLARTRVRSFG
jgi:hypothetical protein